MSEFEGGGISIGGVTYGVTKYPAHYSRIQLYRAEKNWFRCVAGFRNDEDAVLFKAWLGSIAEAKR